MRSKRTFYALLGVTAVMVVAAVLSQRPARDSVSEYGLHAPGLDADAQTVEAIEIRTAGGTLRLARTGDDWVAASKNDYPADADRVRRLVLGLARLQRLEKKTGDPDKLAALELTDVGEPASKAVQLTLLTAEDEKLVSVLVGRTDEFQSSGRSRYFVRNTGDPQSWLVEGSLPPVLDEFGNWLEQDLMPGVERADLRSLAVTHPDGETVTVRRESGDGAGFELADLSAGEQIKDRHSINSVVDTFRGLSLEDVRAAPRGTPDEAALTIEALTFDGVRINARFNKEDPGYGVRLSARYEPGSDRSTKEGNGDHAERTNGEHLARDLDARWSDRLFIVGQYSVEPLVVRRADLIEKPEEPESME